MWEGNWREQFWSQVDQDWDILIIGGGITGAGILREATRLGLKVLLVEQNDFASGTSSRSSKLVHGGLRYLKEGKIRLTASSVHERQQLLAEGPGLIDPLGFLLSVYKGDFPGRLTYGFGLTVYDLMALHWDHSYYSPDDFQMLAPHIARRNLQGGFRYGDAQTDDARLVLRVLREAVAEGGLAINYTAATGLLWQVDPATGERQVCGAGLLDRVSGDRAQVRARVTINATGAWADRLRAEVGSRERIRPLRGSHLVFSHWRLPVAQAVSFLHPFDHRPVMIFPWEGVTLVGTTDVDLDTPLDEEPGISPQEVAYLMAAVEYQFPALHLGLQDINSTFAGVRPVIGTGKTDPSKESRDHVVWEESGLLTITGGKMTTFRLIGLDALKAARSRLPEMPELNGSMPVLNPVNIQMPAGLSLDESTRRRLLGRYGADAPALLSAAQPGEIEFIPGMRYLWAELRWAARSEGVIHLDDLLLRRVRLGLLLPQGGAYLLPEIRRICQPELGWDDTRWQAEELAFLRLWQRCYGIPDPDLIPDWQAMLSVAQAERRARHVAFRKKLARRSAASLLLISLATSLLVLLYKRFSDRE